MKAPNSGSLRCSAKVAAEIFDKEQVKCDLAAQALKSSGTLRLRALGLSMLPSIWPGDILTIQAQSFEQCRPDDVVLYTRHGCFFLHRVVAITGSGDSLILRGDWLQQFDPPVDGQQVLGKAVDIERRGRHFSVTHRPGIASRILAHALRNCSLLLRVVMAIRAHRPCHATMTKEEVGSFTQWA
jgi:hypothetical protein